MTATAALDVLVGNAYSSADKTAALTYAANVLNLTADADDQGDIAIANVAKAMLTNKRIQEAGRTRPELLINLINIEKLVTSETMRLAVEQDSGTIHNIIQYKQPDNSKHYSMG